MQQSQTYIANSEHDDGSALARNISSLIELYPGIITSYDDLRPKVPSPRWGAFRRRDNEDTVEMILNVQDDFERLARKTGFDRNDLNVIIRRLFEMETATWIESTERSYDFKANIMPRFPSDKYDSGVEVNVRYDTQSDANWISMSLLERAGYYPATDIVASRERSILSIGGQKKQPLGEIQVVWRTSSKKERQTVFLVLEHLGFDLVIGKGLVEGYAEVALSRLPQHVQHGVKNGSVKVDPPGHRKTSSGSHTRQESPQSPSASFSDNSRLREPENISGRRSGEDPSRNGRINPVIPHRPTGPPPSPPTPTPPIPAKNAELARRFQH